MPTNCASLSASSLVPEYAGEDLTDQALREEIELVGDLIVAAAACAGRMPQEDLDLVLGVIA